jgi:hypothetical protein
MAKGATAPNAGSSEGPPCRRHNRHWGASLEEVRSYDAQLAPGWTTTDARLILLARGLRSFGQGSVSVLLAIYLQRLGFSLVEMGLAVATLLSLLIVVMAETLGRRRLMVLFSALTPGAAAALTFSESFPLLTATAFLAGFRGSGPTIGPVQPRQRHSRRQAN